MKRTISILTIALFATFLLGTETSAQMMQQQKGMMQGGMHQGMMGQMMQGGMMGKMMQGGMMGGMMGRMHRGFDFFLGKAKQLELTPEQIKKLRDMKFQFEIDNARRKADLEVAKIELKRLKADEKADPKQIEAKIREVQNKKAELEIALFRAKRQAKSVLTEEQRAKLSSMSCPMCGQMHGSGMGGMMGGSGMMGSGKMGMKKNSQEESSSQHEAHHKKQ